MSTEADMIHNQGGIHMARPIALRAVFAALIVALALPGATLAAKPIAAFHDHFTDSFPSDICGIAVQLDLVVTDNFFEYADGSFKDAGSNMSTFTNPDNGKAVVVSSAGTLSGTAIVDEGANTITFVTTYKGLPEKIQTAHGRVLTRDAGIISFRDTFDLTTGDFLGTQVTIRGPHPEADADFALFCDVVTGALT
jgi:hypothetical protein